MNKVFPKSRVCVIDVYPSFERGLKLAINFANKNNIKLNSGDGRRLIVGCCLQNIQSEYKNTKSPFPKVICMSKKAISKRVSLFINEYFEKILDQMPIPYCGQIDLSSPDLELAAEHSLKKHKPQKNFANLVAKLKLNNLERNFFSV